MGLKFTTRAGKLRPILQAAPGTLAVSSRQHRMYMCFRMVIVVLTLVVSGALWAAFPTGRAAILEAGQKAKWSLQQTVGLEPARSEIDAYWRDRRDRREVSTRERYNRLFASFEPDRQAFLRAAGMAPEEAVIRWGNYDMTLAMSGKVFVRDDSGRYYRLRPGVRSAWYRRVAAFGADVCQLIFLDTPEVRRLAEAIGAEVVPDIVHTTNSWGCRGPEPNMDAPIRVLVLGDSFMEGYMVGDDETPPEQLRQTLRAEAGKDVAVLNTGTLGYGPEHYYYTLVSYLERFGPRFVVLGLYSNDFGEDREVLRAECDWTEGKYWLERILETCRAHRVLCVIAPVPCEAQLVGPRNAGNYPGQVANMTKIPGPRFCDPTEAFIDEDLKLREAEAARGVVKVESLLYNTSKGDGHLSPAGAALWGRVVARRLAHLLAIDDALADDRG
jgi:lysophospholipase L1-like esterase